MLPTIFYICQRIANTRTMYYTFYFRKATETSPFYLVLRDGKEKEVISLKLTEDPNTFNKDTFVFEKTNIRYKYLNEMLTRVKRVCDTGINEMIAKGGDLRAYRSYVERELHIKEKPVKAGSFLPYFRDWARAETTKRKASRQRVMSYSTFALYCDSRGISPSFNDMTYALCEDYIEWMAKEKGLVANSRGTKVKDLKACLNEAFLNKLHNNSDFRQFRKEVEEVDNVYLTSDEVERIASLELTGALDKARDIFLVGCHTGMRYSDYSRVSMADITNGVIHNVNQKTNNRVDIPAHPRVIAILNKWGGKVPSLSQQKINECIKVVCMRAGITEPVTLRRDGTTMTREKWEFVTTHTARRTGITNMYKAGVPIYRCMMISGHKTERVFLQYIKITTEENAQFLADNPFFKGK